jgi:hypothetical protein
VELLAVPTTLCETMIKVTIKYLQKGMREAVFKNKDRNDDKLGFKNYIEKDLTDVKLKYLKICSDHFITASPEISSVIRQVLFRTQVSRLQHNLAGLFIPIADKRGGDMELIDLTIIKKNKHTYNFKIIY